jgi:hypothetical protein
MVNFVPNPQKILERLSVKDRLIKILSDKIIKASITSAHWLPLVVLNAPVLIGVEQFPHWLRFRKTQNQQTDPLQEGRRVRFSARTVFTKKSGDSSVSPLVFVPRKQAVLYIAVNRLKRKKHI